MNQWDFLTKKFEAGQLAHAYILAGANHQAKKTFTDDFIKYISKSIAVSKTAIEKGQFPDLMVVKSADSDSSVKNEKDMMEIDIGQVRIVQDFLSYKSYYGGYKTVVIEHAERMNAHSQNCLLKNLEEPKGDTLIFLLAGTSEMLLPTISSRCQVIKFYDAPGAVELPQNLQNILGADLAEKFLYVKNANLEGENFENILQALQNHWRKDIGKYQNVLKLALDLERQVKVSNVNKKLALEILLLEI